MSQFPAFPEYFQALWGDDYNPFPWQRMLAERLVEATWPKVLDLPTSAGKTACIDIALYALAAQADRPVWERTAPRRVWFVVDRRIVVDEAFYRAREIAQKLRQADDGPLKTIADCLRKVSGTDRPLALARLRGGVLHDDGWARLPCQPAVITSTVDQLGSRLLFRGYGRSALAAPIFAGLAAHDSLILLDEAHLSVPFIQTLRTVERYLGEDWAEEPIRTPFAFAMLTATPPADIPEAEVFPGPDREAALDHPRLAQRTAASKPAELVSIKTTRGLETDPLVIEAAQRAETWAKKGGKRRVAVIVNRVRTATSVAEALREGGGDEIDVVLLTGQLRPFERDRLVERWSRVLKAGNPEEPARPVVLVSTQCIEVGADFSFDAMVTEAASLDALRQRFGRLNRLGHLEASPAAILIREEDAKGEIEDPIYGSALAECWRLLQERAAPRTEDRTGRKLVDFGVAALDALLQDVDDLASYLAPSPDAPMLLPSHVDLLCQTAPRPEVEPDVQLYLHGTDRGTPEVRVAWRADLEEQHTETWVETAALCPPNSAETATVPLFRLRQWLSDIQDGNEAGDVEGAREAEVPAAGQSRPALVWQGRDRSYVCEQATGLKPNDLVLVPAAYGIEGLAQSEPAQALGEARLDIWEPSHAQAGKPPALRLCRAVLTPWLDYPPLLALLELAEAPDWGHEEVRDAIDAVLAHSPAGDDDLRSLPNWLLELLIKVRDGRYEQHPAGGLLLRARKVETQEEGEQDVFADDDDLLSVVGEEVSLVTHSALVERAVAKLAERCLPAEFSAPLRTAAYWHDVGKVDERFQILLRQGNELALSGAHPLAKSAGMPNSPARRRAIRAASGLPDCFRHEMLSLQLAERFMGVEGREVHADLLLHAIASHHGHGRPFAPLSSDPEPPQVHIVHDGMTIQANPFDRANWPAPHSLDSGICERFWRLNRRYGWWGLAYLEAILRLGDWYGSRWKVEETPAMPQRARSASRPRNMGNTNGGSLTLTGVDGANPLAFLAALGVLVVLHQAGDLSVRLGWRREGLAWRPTLFGLPAADPAALSERLAHRLQGTVTSEAADEQRKESEERLAQKKREIKTRRDEVKKRQLHGRERAQALREEVEPMEQEARVLRAKWREALRASVPSPELALGKNIDCTDADYRSIAMPLLDEARLNQRESVDLLAAFCSSGRPHESPLKRKEGKLAVTPFALISGSGHQDFLDTAGALLRHVTPERLAATLFMPWAYEDEGLSMRWDPIEDRRYALMDRDPTASDNKPRTVWMANLLAYRALALFPVAPARDSLLATGWSREAENEEYVFTWPLWRTPLIPDSIRSLLLLKELSSPARNRFALRARGICALFRVRRIKVGAGANFKLNFSSSREV
jgi:CRISPR-associated endonuclease/helicase Cas3